MMLRSAGAGIADRSYKRPKKLPVRSSGNRTTSRAVRKHETLANPTAVASGHNVKP